MLRDEIVPYLDGNGYVCPNPTHGEQRGSDNGTMFSSEFFIILALRGEDNERDAEAWDTLIARCEVVPGLTVRAPGDNATDAPDNLVAILAAAKVLGKPMVAEDILNHGITNFGFYNPNNPGEFKNVDGTMSWNTFQWRQLQLVFAMLCASGKHKWYKLWHLPLAIYTALTIAVSCIKFLDKDKQYRWYDLPVMVGTALMNLIKGTTINPQETDPRRLSWLLIQAVQDDSLLCRLAAKVWWRRLHDDYGVDGMRVVAAIYYHGEDGGPHPFARYFVNKGE